MREFEHFSEQSLREIQAEAEGRVATWDTIIAWAQLQRSKYQRELSGVEIEIDLRRDPNWEGPSP